MAGQIYVSVEQLNDMLAAMRTCRSKYDSAGRKANSAVDTIMEECGGSSYNAGLMTKAGTRAVLSNLDSGISALETAINLYSATDNASKIDISKLAVPTVVGFTASILGPRTVKSAVNLAKGATTIGKIINNVGKVDRYQEKINVMESIALPQYRYNRSTGTVYSGKKTNDKDASICTTVSNVQLMNNYLSLNGSSGSISVQQAIDKQKTKNKTAPYNATYGVTYEVDNYRMTTVRVDGKDYGGYGTRTEYIVHLLDEHPEGIQLYMNYSGGAHAITIVGYRNVTNDDGTSRYAFDAIDGVGYYDDNGKLQSFDARVTDINSTWLFHKYSKKDVQTLLNSSNVIDLKYIRVEENV